MFGTLFPAGTKLIDDAFQIQKRYVLSFWDSLVLASAPTSSLLLCAYRRPESRAKVWQAYSY